MKHATPPPAAPVAGGDPLPFELPGRQVHLDFHTAPQITDVGVEFDAGEFAETMKAAHVNSVTVFAKCHHGHLYYNTKRPERHPGLVPGLDLLGRQVEALHREGIRAPIYVSVQVDEYAAGTHPEWVARQEDGRPVGSGPLAPGWRVLDMSGPYQEYLVEQVREVLRTFKPVDGVFFDMCWDQPSLSSFAVERMLRADLDPEKEEDRRAHARRVAHGYLRRLHQMVKESSRHATVYFNGRPLVNLAQESQFLEQVEIESLPTGGWGYLYFPRTVRFARNFGRQCAGMTSRFHKGWGDFGGLKPQAALEYETAQMMAQGAACSVGDQMHPRGTLDRAAYELIGRVYARAEAREPWLRGAKPVTQVGLFQLPTSGGAGSGTDEGAVRMLTQLKAQFDVIGKGSDLSGYELLVLPDFLEVTPELAEELSRFVTGGGAILATGSSGLSADATRVVLPELGVHAAGWSPFQTTYLRFGKEVARDVPATDHAVYERGVRVTSNTLAGSHVLAKVVEPYFDRSWRQFCSHAQTPPDKVSRWAGATLSRNGRVAFVSFPVFSAFANHGSAAYRLLVRNLLDRLLPEPLVRVEGPTTLEATVTRQATAEPLSGVRHKRTSVERTIVHLLHYCPERRTKTLDLVEDVVPLFDVPLSLKLEKPPQRVYLTPDRTELLCEHAAGRARVVVPRVDGHAMVVFE